MKLENYSKALIPTTQQLFIVSNMAPKVGVLMTFWLERFTSKTCQNSYQPEGHKLQFKQFSSNTRNIGHIETL